MGRQGWLTVAALAGIVLSGCGSSATPAGTAHGLRIVAIARTVNGDMQPISGAGSMVLPLTGGRARDVVRYTYSISAPQTLTVTDARRRVLLTVANVQAVGAIEFKAGPPPLLLVAASTNGQWGFPVTAYRWDASQSQMVPVPFSFVAGQYALYRWNGRAFLPDSGPAAVPTSVLGFARATRSDLRVEAPVPQFGSPFPSNYSLTTRWVYTLPQRVWLLQSAVFGPDQAPQGQLYPRDALGTAEAYLTSLALALPKAAAGLAAPGARGIYARNVERFAPPGIGTPLPSFDESAFNAAEAAKGRPGMLAMYLVSGAGPTLGLHAYNCHIGLRRTAAGQWQVTSLGLRTIPLRDGAPSDLLGGLLRVPGVRPFLRAHPSALLRIGVGASGESYYAEIDAGGAPGSVQPLTFNVDAATGTISPLR